MFEIEGQNVYQINDNSKIHYGLVNQCSVTSDETNIIYQWQKFNIDKGIYENDINNVTTIQNQTPINGQVVIKKEIVQPVQFVDENTFNSAMAELTTYVASLAK